MKRTIRIAGLLCLLSMWGVPDGLPGAGASGQEKRTAASGEQDVAEGYQRSYVLESEGKYQEAWQTMRALEMHEKNRYIYQLRIGWLSYLAGDYATSRLAYLKASSIKPGSLGAKLGMLLPLIAERNFREAERTARGVLKVDPLNYLAISRLASVYYESGRYRKAGECYEKLRRVYPGDFAVASGLAWSRLKEGRRQEAEKIFRWILRVAPKYSQARAGLTQARTGRP